MALPVVLLASALFSPGPTCACHAPPDITLLAGDKWFLRTAGPCRRPCGVPGVPALHAGMYLATPQGSSLTFAIQDGPQAGQVSRGQAAGG